MPGASKPLHCADAPHDDRVLPASYNLGSRRRSSRRRYGSTVFINITLWVASEIRCKSMGAVPASWSGYSMVLTVIGLIIWLSAVVFPLGGDER